MLDQRLLDLGAHLQVGLLPGGGRQVEPPPAQLVLELIHGGQDPTQTPVRKEVEEVAEGQTGLGSRSGPALGTARPARRRLFGGGAMIFLELDQLGDQLGQGLGRRRVRGHMLKMQIILVKIISY